MRDKKRLIQLEEQFGRLSKTKLAISYTLKAAIIDENRKNTDDARFMFDRALLDCESMMQDPENQALLSKVYGRNLDFYIELYSLIANVFFYNAAYTTHNGKENYLRAKEFYEKALTLIPGPDERQKTCHNRIAYCDQQINGTQRNNQFEAIEPDEPLSSPGLLPPVNDQSTLSLLSMNTGIHGFFYHRDDLSTIDEPLPDLFECSFADEFCDASSDESESQPSATKKPKSLDSTDNLEDDSTSASKSSPSSPNNGPAH